MLVAARSETTKPAYCRLDQIATCMTGVITRSHNWPTATDLAQTPNREDGVAKLATPAFHAPPTG